jgi:hypothetical protein
VSAAESAERPGSLPTRRAGGDCSSDCQEATSLARRATAWSSAASRAAPGICALAACCVGSKRPPRGMETCSASMRRSSAGELMLAAIQASSVEGADRGSRGGRRAMRQSRRPARAAAPTRERQSRRVQPGTGWDRGAACTVNYLSGFGACVSEVDRDPRSEGRDLGHPFSI